VGCTSGILSVTAAAMLCPVLLLEGFTVWLVCSEKAHHALCNVLMVVCIGRVLSWVSLWGITRVVICPVRMATVVLVGVEV
jgi:hypothetical protein